LANFGVNLATSRLFSPSAQIEYNECMTALILKVVLAYLLGSVSGSLLMGKIKKVDIRRQGSGNAGSTNAFRTQGLIFGLAVIIIDISKGFLAAWWIPSLEIVGAAEIVDPAWLAMACGFAAVLGHCFPLWHGFRGGKGAATAVGAMMVIEPWLLLPVAITWLVILLATGYVGLATVLSGFSLVPAAWYLGNSALLAFSTVLALFLLYTHRGNMRKLRDHTEHRFKHLQLFSRKH
jgi:glycerol-3-phosphate acyltransferase PlsY